MRMIAVVDRTPDAETPLKGIEKVPEGTDPDDVFKECLEDYDGSAQMGYMFIHPAFGALVQASYLDHNFCFKAIEIVSSCTASETEPHMLNQYMFSLCSMIEVESDFSITPEVCTMFYLGFKNKRTFPVEL